MLVTDVRALVTDVRARMRVLQAMRGSWPRVATGGNHQGYMAQACVQSHYRDVADYEL